VSRGELLKLARIGKVSFTDAKTKKPIVQNIFQPIKDRLHMDIERYFIQYKEGKIAFRVAMHKVQNRAPEKLRPILKTLLNGYKTKAITWAKLNKQLGEIVAKYLAEKKAEKPVRPPKFEAPVLWHPCEFPVIKTVDEFAYNTEMVNKLKDIPDEVLTEISRFGTLNVTMPDLMWLGFETRGPSGKRVWVQTTLEGYLANVVLHNYPKAMPLLMQVAKGEMEAPKQSELTGHFLRDPFVAYDKEWMQHPMDRFAFCQLCWDILHNDGLIFTFFDLYYSNELKIGDQVRVYNDVNACDSYGVIVEVEGGLSVHYDGGDVEKIRRNEVIRLYEYKKKK
jgi:hypothetical protein